MFGDNSNIAHRLNQDDSYESVFTFQILNVLMSHINNSQLYCFNSKWRALVICSCVL